MECIDPDGETARASWGLRLSLEGRSYGLRVRGREATVSGRAAPVEVHSNCCVPATYKPLNHPSSGSPQPWPIGILPRAKFAFTSFLAFLLITYSSTLLACLLSDFIAGAKTSLLSCSIQSS